MPVGTWGTQWLNWNSQRSYPITDGGDKRDRTATIRIPNSFLLAMYFPVHAGLDVEPDKFFIKGLGVYPTGYSVTLGYDDGTASPPVVGTVNIAAATHVEFRSYAIAGSGDFADSVGQVAIGKLDEVNLLPPGQYDFLPAATPLEADVIRPMIRGISSITVVNGSDRSEPIVGDVELVAEENIRISVSAVDGQPTQIVFSAISGAGLNEECVCDEADTEAVPLRFINGIPPLPNGNFRMVGDECLTVTPIQNGLQLRDVCSKPCCGCDELSALVAQIDRFADGVVTLQNFVTNLGGTVNQMSNVVLGSRLGDTGCIEC